MALGIAVPLNAAADDNDYGYDDAYRDGYRAGYQDGDRDEDADDREDGAEFRDDDWYDESYAPEQEQTFQQTLAPYGEWIVAGSYGRVWRPHVTVVGAGFTPYSSRGRWVYTDYGWAFESEFDWGWVPFHYGRWVWEPVYGWVWIPGYRWAPAWVEWRFGGGYVGWAPYGMGTSVDYWTYVETRHFAERDCHRYAVAPAHRHHVHAATAAWAPRVHDARPVFGPPRGEVERAWGHRVAPAPLGQLSRVTGPIVRTGEGFSQPRFGAPRYRHGDPGRGTAPGYFGPGARPNERRHGPIAPNPRPGNEAPRYDRGNGNHGGFGNGNAGGRGNGNHGGFGDGNPGGRGNGRPDGFDRGRPAMQPTHPVQPVIQQPARKPGRPAEQGRPHGQPRGSGFGRRGR